MSNQFLGEIKIVAFNYAPRTWAMCNGQFLPINQNQALFSLLGTMYGGNGQTTFALPDLRGQVPIHIGGGFILGQKGGQQAHTLTQSEMPTHTHFVNVLPAAATLPNPNNTRVLANSAGASAYAAAANLQPMDPRSLSSIGGSQAHENMQPYLTLTFCIALTGIFPTQN